MGSVAGSWDRLTVSRSYHELVTVQRTAANTAAMQNRHTTLNPGTLIGKARVSVP